MGQNRYNINDRVYHVTPESPVGVVTDAQYDLRTGLWMYYVAFSAEVATLLYYEDELSVNKTY